MKENKLTNVDYRLIEKDEDEENGKNAAYVRVMEDFEKESLDFVLVDGIYRGACAVAVLSKVRPGGILIIDNANWFLPCKSRSPCSRSFEQGPASQIWDDFFHSVREWRRVWTTNGVCDTAIYFKTV